MEFNNYILLIVDPQNDFCHPDGALYVPGAQEDMLRLAEFVIQNKQQISQIIITRDEHQVNDISHPSFWCNEFGEFPAPYTSISLQDVEQKRWYPLFMNDEVKQYLYDLEQSGEMAHVIWPEHCLAGSWGAAIDDNVMEAVADWARDGHFYTIVSKGQNPLTEHFGALRANVMRQDDSSTQVNHRLVSYLAEASHIIIAGEARSHCVANTLKQMMEQPAIQGQIILLSDCMSNVEGMEDVADSIYNKAIETGVQWVESSSFVFED